MKIIYILKKGFKYYPPCLAQLLMLSDQGIELEVYHGLDTEYINALLEERGIVHHLLKSDGTYKNKLSSAWGLFKYIFEIKKIIKSVDKDAILWFGNAESILMLNKQLNSRKYVLSILELYDRDTLYHKQLKKLSKNAMCVISCEKHRAAINEIEYGLPRMPYIMPNKPYFLDNRSNECNYLNSELKHILETKFVILYQGIITKDRPLDKIAEAMSRLDNDELYFVVMGKCDAIEKKRLSEYYKKIIFTGFIPNPEHLLVTKYAKVGIANYDFSCLNNMFCAPNKIYEYAQFSIPMLTSKNIGLVETVGIANAAVCIDFNDVNEIKIGLQKIISNYEEYRRGAEAFYNGTDNMSVMAEIVNDLRKQTNE